MCVCVCVCVCVFVVCVVSVCVVCACAARGGWGGVGGGHIPAMRMGRARLGPNHRRLFPFWRGFECRCAEREQGQSPVEDQSNEASSVSAEGQ
jgi:hypothetical protein